MNNKIIIGVLVAVVVIGGVVFLMQNQQQPASNNGTPTIDNINITVPPENNQQDNNNQPTENQPKTHEIIYTDAGYAPKETTIKIGDTVTWKNQSSKGMWTSSTMHPTHTVYSGTSLEEHCPDTTNTSFDQCTSGQPGTSWSFTFTKKGTWRYHNHMGSSHFGSVIVE